MEENKAAGIGEEEKKKIKEENEKKKYYLFGYKRARNEIERCEAALEEVRQMRIMPSVVSDGMPRGSGGSRDMSDYSVKIEKAERDCEEARYKAIMVCMEIRGEIEIMVDDTQKNVLTDRYIKLMDWERIAQKRGYSYHHVLKIHGAALKNFKVDTQ